MSRTFLSAFSLALATMALPAAAQVHSDDVRMGVSGGKLTVSGAPHTNLQGLSIFEGDLGDLAGGLFSTDDPGFDSAPGTFGSGVRVNYQAHGPLHFWNGSAWSSAAVPSAVTLRLEGNLGETTLFASNGISGDASGLIGVAGTSGQIHEHLDWTVLGGNRTAVGAYYVSLSLAANGFASSDPFYVVLNRGLDEAAFETSVQALAAVPEPSVWALSLLGLAAVGWRAKRAAAQQ